MPQSPSADVSGSSWTGAGTTFGSAAPHSVTLSDGSSSRSRATASRYRGEADSPKTRTDATDLWCKNHHRANTWSPQRLTAFQLSLDPGTLTDEGVDAFRSAVRPAVDTCLASRMLAAGCGLDVAPVLADGTVVDEGSLTRTLAPGTEARIASPPAQPEGTQEKPPSTSPPETSSPPPPAPATANPSPARSPKAPPP
ncbi:MAG: hypothetical protein FWF02_04450 [Micrococcales bacterium]|nr:hypothetical protein [Micrococcales bacterium]MCL2666942.1 hypothetical protein [Micrococcales bacterium]